MKRILFALLSSTFLLLSCGNTAVSQGFQVSGTIENAPNETLYLEMLTLTSIQALDTVKTDEKGAFVCKGIVSEYSICRLRLSNNSSWMLLLDNKDKISFQANKNDVLKYSIKGGKGNELFLKMYNASIAAQNDINQLNGKYMQLYQSGADPLIVNAVKDSLNMRLSVFEKEFKLYADTCSNPLLALFAASFINAESDLPLMKKTVAKLEKYSANSVYTQQFKVRIQETETQLMQAKQQEDLAKKTAVGSIPPDINLPTPDGKNLNLYSLKGKVVLLDFWASWCGPCRRENPNVVSVYNKYKEKGFTVFSVSLDKAADPWKAAIIADGLVWPNHVSDLKGWGSVAAAAYGINSIPRAFLLDREGKIVATNLRGEELERKVQELLGN